MRFKVETAREEEERTEKDVKMQISRPVGRCVTNGPVLNLTASSATTLRRSQRPERKSRTRQVEEVIPAASDRGRQELITSRQAGPKEAGDAPGARAQDEDKERVKVKIKEKVKEVREAKVKG